MGLKAIVKWCGLYWRVLADVLFQKLLKLSVPRLEQIGSDARGKVALVTGPTSGIGRETALELARRGATVVLACRNVASGSKLAHEIEKIQEDAGHSAAVHVVKLDLNSLESVQECVHAFRELNLPLHILINNAGVYDMGRGRQSTADGFEMHMGVNHLAHFCFTLYLLPLLKASAPSTQGGARIVNVASLLHVLSRLRPSDVLLQKESRYSSLTAYANSKCAQVLFTRLLRKFLVGSGVHVFAVHPGDVQTDIGRNLPALIKWAYTVFVKWVLFSVKEGARASVYCATAREAPAEAVPSHGYIDSSCKSDQPGPQAADDRLAVYMWQFSVSKCKVPKELDPFDVHVALPWVGT